MQPSDYITINVINDNGNVYLEQKTIDLDVIYRTHKVSREWQPSSNDACQGYVMDCSLNNKGNWQTYMPLTMKGDPDFTHYYPWIGNVYSEPNYWEGQILNVICGYSDGTVIEEYGNG